MQLVLRHLVWRVQGIEWSWTTFPNASVVHKMFMYWEICFRCLHLQFWKCWFYVYFWSSRNLWIQHLPTCACWVTYLTHKRWVQSLYIQNGQTTDLPIGDMKSRGKQSAEHESWIFLLIWGYKALSLLRKPTLGAVLQILPSPDLWSCSHHWTVACFPRTFIWIFLMWAQLLPRVCKYIYSKETLTFSFA